jgi:hypothetical protein
MNGLTGQFAAQRPVHQLVLFHPAEAAKGGGHHRDLQVLAAAGEVFHLHGGIRQGLGDGGFHLVGMDQV